MEHPALTCFQQRGESHARLICFPHTGGGAHAYADWGQSLPGWLEVHSVAYPGRGSRLGDAFCESLEAVATECCTAIRMIADRPLFLLGHSFGALVAIEVALRLDADGLTPLRVFASSMPPPQLMRRWSLSLTAMPDAQLLTALARRGWLSAAVGEIGGPAMVKYGLPPLRVDLRLLETYQCCSTAKPMPITAIGGELDGSVSQAELDAWSMWSDSEFEVKIERCLLSLQRSVLALSDGLVKAPESADARALVIEQLGLLSGASSSRRNAAAVISPGTREPTTSFSRIYHLVCVLAAALVGSPFHLLPETVCAVYLPASVEYVIANLAIFAARAAMVYFEVNYTRKLIADLVTASGTLCVLTQKRLSAHLPEGLAHVLLDASWETKLWALVARAALNAGAISRLLDSRVDPRSLAYCSMSSGTTGAPKAILVEHHSFMHNIRARNAVCPYDSNPTVDIEACNVFFVWEALRAPTYGRSTLVVPNDVVVDGKQLLRFLVDYRATRLMVTPSLLRNLLDQPRLDFARFVGSQLRYVLLEGELVPTTLVADFTSAFATSRTTLVNYYSTWESLDVACTTLFDPARKNRTKMWLRALPPGSAFAPVGRPLPWVCFLVRDKAFGHIVPRGVPGTIHVVAKSVARGYLGDPEKTAMRFFTNPMPMLASSHDGVARATLAVPWLLDAAVRCYDTGDRGIALETGSLLLLGRADATIKIRGFKVALNYVERNIAAAPSIHACIVRPVIDQSQQPKGLVAYVTATLAFSMQHITQHLKEVLPEYAIPSHIVLLEAFPSKPGSGKVDYSRLPAPTCADRLTDNVIRLAEKRDTAAEIAFRHSTLDAATGDIQDPLYHSWGRVAAGAISDAFNTVLERTVPLNSNFFELGGHSLRASKTVGLINTTLGVDLAVVDLFEAPSIVELTGLLVRRRHDMIGRASTRRSGDSDQFPFANVKAATGNVGPWQQSLFVVGAAAILPGADDLITLWHNMISSYDSLSVFTAGDLRSRDVQPSLIADSNFVPVAQMIRGALVISFDAFFWGISVREARIMDPQHRKLLEVAWHARERAGRGVRLRSNFVDATGIFDDAGVFASTGIDGYLIHHLGGAPLLDMANPGAVWLGETGSEKDYAPTRVSYQLGLTGPSVSVGSACSSSLVACALATTAIFVGDCRAALVGGASLTFPNLGYKFVDGLVHSADGRVRPLDVAASGTLFGDSVGVLCLEVDDDGNSGRPILCQLVATSVTNDGRAKAGYSAPSALAQARAITQSTRRARLTGRDVDAVELHATATKLGDAIEVSGVTRALGVREAATDAPLRLTCIKGNIGHANCAAGLTGLLKACLMLGHDTATPIAHFKAINPKIRVPTGARIVTSDLDHDIDHLGISSFGVGGTNAHVVLCAAPHVAVHAAGHYGLSRADNRDTYCNYHQSDHYVVPSAPDGENGLLAAIAYAAMRDAAAKAAASAALVVGRPLTASAKVTAAILADKVDHALAPSRPLCVAPAQRSCNRGQIATAARSESIDGVGAAENPRAPEVLLLSARTEASLRGLVAQLRDFLTELPPESSLEDVSFTLQEGRNHWPEWRVAVVAKTAAEAAQGFAKAELVAPASPVSATNGELCVAIGGFTGGQDSLTCIPFGVAFDLYETHAAFRSRIRACASILDGPLRSLPPYDTPQGRTFAPDSLLDALGYTEAARLRSTLATHGKSSVLAADLTRSPVMNAGIFYLSLARPAVAEPATFALLYALGSCLAFGHGDAPAFPLSPFFAAVAGKGIGQLVALALDGAIALDDACLLALERGLHLGEYDTFETLLNLRFQDRPGLIRAPQRAPIADGVRGDGWLGLLDARDPAYWRRHAEQDHACNLGSTWTKNLEQLLSWQPAFVVAIDCVRQKDADVALNLVEMRGRQFTAPVAACITAGTRGAYAITNCLAQAWVHGVDVHWNNMRVATHGSDGARSPPQIISGIPGYIFAATPHWTNPKASCYAPVDGWCAEGGKSTSKPSKLCQLPTGRAIACLPNHSALVRKSSNSGPWTARAICAAYAGGTSSTFNTWRVLAPSWLDIIVIELAGRGTRADEASTEDDATDESELASLRISVDSLVSDGLPWVFVGLSAGALLCLELINSKSWPLLMRVVLAGRAPLHTWTGPTVLIPSEDEIKRMYAFAPQDMMVSDAFARIALPRLKADLGRDARAEYRLSCRLDSVGFLLDKPLLVLCGAHDSSFSLDVAVNWCDSTSCPDSLLIVMPGGHGFLLHAIGAVLAEVVTLLEYTRPMTALKMGRALALPPTVAYIVGWDQLHLLDYNADPPTAHVVNLRSLHREAIKHVLAATTHAGHLILDCLEPWPIDGDTEWLMREEAAAFSFVQVLKALAERAKKCVVYIVSRTSMRGALVAGTAKCAGFEVPELDCRRVYLRVSSAAVRALDEQARIRLVSFLAIAAPAGETDTILTPDDGTLTSMKWTCTGQRARAHESVVQNHASLYAHAKSVLGTSSYILITGASGGLGVALIDWLVDMAQIFASRLILVVRNGRAASRFDSWNVRPRIRVAKLLHCLDDLEAAKLPPCATIFHLAGTLKDAMLPSLMYESFSKPIVPKAGGLISLRRLSSESNWPVRSLVAYSSTTSLYGFGGQTNYAAANSILDAAADFGDDDNDNRGERHPSVIVAAIHWGLWGGAAGMAQEGTKAWDTAIKSGDQPLPTEVAFAALGAVLTSHRRGSARPAIFSVEEWSWSPWRFLAATTHLVPARARNTPQIMSATSSSPDGVRLFLEARVSDWLPDQTLEALGLDSLDLAQIRADTTQLGPKLPPLAYFADADRTLGELAVLLRDHFSLQ